MTNVKKIFLFLAIILFAIVLTPNISKATTTEVNNEDTLKQALTNATNGDIIMLTTDIKLSRPIELTDKTVNINGAGHTISRNTDTWQASGDNGSLITAGNKASITLLNITLRDSQKYGVQAYNGGYVALDNVTIADCGFGGVLVNAGTVEVRDLMLHKNGANSNNGIEIAKGTSVSTGDNQPTLIMNGKLSSTQTENVVYLAVNDNLAEFQVVNTENTVNKIFATGKKVVITDEKNNIIFESNESDKATIKGENFIPNVTITIYLNEQNIEVTVPQDTVLTKEDLQQQINLKDLNLSDYIVEGFYVDEAYKTEYDFTKPFTEDTTIYAKLSLQKTNEPEKDTSPKTGVESHLTFATFILLASVLGIVAFKRKEF